MMPPACNIYCGESCHLEHNRRPLIVIDAASEGMAWRTTPR